VAIAALPAVEIDVFDSGPVENGLRIARELRRVQGLEGDVKRGREGNGSTVDRGHLHHLVERSILTNEPAARATSRPVVVRPPEDLRVVVGVVVDEDDLADLDPWIAHQRDGIGSLDCVGRQIDRGGELGRIVADVEDRVARIGGPVRLDEPRAARARSRRAGAEPRSVQSDVLKDSPLPLMLNVPALSLTTWSAGQPLRAAWMAPVSSPPLGDSVR